MTSAPLSIALLVVSDRASRGERVDGCEAAVGEWLAREGERLADVAVVPDGLTPVAEKLTAWSDQKKYALILTAGGTGLSPRDQTPEATLAVAERLAPGIPEAMRAASFAKTPNAILSRGVAVQRGSSLIVNLPGSPPAAVENLSVVFTALRHGIKKMLGDQSDCAPRA